MDDPPQQPAERPVRRSTAPERSYSIAIRGSAAFQAAFAIDLVHDWQCSRGMWAETRSADPHKSVVWNRQRTDGLFISHAPEVRRHPVGSIGFMAQDATRSQSACCEVG
jgi:hypothetical protein